MTYKPNRAQLDALIAQVRDSFIADELGVDLQALVPEVVHCVASLLNNAADLEPLGHEIHTILICLPSFTEKTPDGQIEHYDLAPLIVRVARARDISGLMREFAPGVIYPADRLLLTRYKGPSQPFGIQGEYFRAVLKVTNVAHAHQVLAELGVSTRTEKIGLVFMEEIAGVHVWGNIGQLPDGSWQLVLEVHDTQTPYTATFTAFTKASIVNRALAEYAIKQGDG
jgi:hypothetical protein